MRKVIPSYRGGKWDASRGDAVDAWRKATATVQFCNCSERRISAALTVECIHLPEKIDGLAMESLNKIRNFSE